MTRHEPLRTDLAPTIGSRFDGIDLRTATDSDYDDFARSLLERKVIFFTKQDLQPEDFRDFGSKMGARLKSHLVEGGKVENLPGHPNIQVLDNDGSKPILGERWHMDDSDYTYPPSAAGLYAQVLPEVGGDTLWADMAAAFRSLSPAVQNFLRGLSAQHDNSAVTDLYLAHDTLKHEEFHPEMWAASPPVIHPVVAQHPQTGEEVLFVNGRFTKKIIELSADESTAVLHMLYQHVKHPEHQYRHRWEIGTVAIWDNLATQHFAVGGYRTQRRMLRISLNQDRGDR
jgi:taurine dioxygenase